MSDNYLNTQSSLSMKGAGYYSAKTQGAKNAIDKTQKVIENAIKTISSTDILRFADFGSADGGTSQEMWGNLIKKSRESNDLLQIEILYTDLASNDFSTLFRTMQGMQGDPLLSFQKKFSNIFVHGCGTGFHQQLMSSGTLSLGFSATAMHYVSEKPCQINNHVHMVGADLSEKAKLVFPCIPCIFLKSVEKSFEAKSVYKISICLSSPVSLINLIMLFHIS